MWGPNYMASGPAGPGVPVSTGYTLSRSSSVCVRFLQHSCPYSAVACPYSHNKDDALLCQAWKRGLCFHNLCSGRHYYLEKDRAPPRREPLRQVRSNTAFSSPLVVKVKTLTEKHRREEVDLETGRRRSWVEMENKELIDITGEASPVAPPKRPVTERLDENGAFIKKKVAEEEAQKKKEMELRERMRGGSSKGSSNKCSGCGKVFKGERGVRSHQNHPQSKCGKSVPRATATNAVPATADMDGSAIIISDDES